MVYKNNKTKLELIKTCGDIYNTLPNISNREISRRTGIHPTTVKRYINLYPKYFTFNSNNTKIQNYNRRKFIIKDSIFNLLKNRIHRRIANEFYNRFNSYKHESLEILGIDTDRIVYYLLYKKPTNLNHIHQLKNYHIDHIIPLNKFDFKDTGQIKLAFSPENHQWLTINSHISKTKEDMKNERNNRRY